MLVALRLELQSLMNKKITSLRLQKEQHSIQIDPLPQAIIVKKFHLVYHFCLLALEEDFTGGFYHGVLELPENYPFSPPKILFITQNGRFEVGKYICTTFTHYHKQTWSSSWNIKTIITALISFMYSNQKGIGGICSSPARKKTLAKKSLRSNCQNPQFIELFANSLISRSIVSAQKLFSFNSHNSMTELQSAVHLNEKSSQILPPQTQLQPGKQAKTNLYYDGHLEQQVLHEGRPNDEYYFISRTHEKCQNVQGQAEKPLLSAQTQLASQNS